MQAHDLLQRDYQKLHEDHSVIQQMLAQRERLIEEHGLILIHLSPDQDEEAGSDHHNNNNSSSSHNRIVSSSASDRLSGPTLISRDIMELLCSFEGVGLEEKLKCMAEEREDLLREIKSLRLDLEEERQQNTIIGGMDRISLQPGAAHSPNAGSNGHHNNQSQQAQQSSASSSESEVKKMLHEYKFKLKRAEQEITLLQGNSGRLENQLSRYKGQCEELERSEEELKIEKRRILRELRDYQSRAEDLETQNANLQKRIHKLTENRIAAIITNGPAAGISDPPASPAITTTTAAAASASGSN